VKTFPLSDPIVLPLAPTIAGTIADYLQSIAQELYVSLSTNYDNANTEFAQDLFWHEDLGRNGVKSNRFAASIGCVPTLQYQYVSPIAHRLATKLGLTPLEICQRLQPLSPSLAVNPRDRLDLYCWYNDSGYIYFQLAPTTIAIWLNYIHDLPLEIQLDRDRSPASVNIALYAHDRCCSLLALAQTEKLVTITDNWQIDRTARSINVRSCPENHFTATLTSIFEEPAEQRLIQTLMEVLDGIYDRRSQLQVVRRVAVSGRAINWAKLTIDLAESWLEFHRHCRIFGDLHRRNPRLAIARCELTAISRRYLQVLLEHYLGVKLIDN
jgi:hypothetical protein